MSDEQMFKAIKQYEQYGAIIPCGSCRNFRPIPNSDYGTCQKHNFQGAVKSTDYCSFAELPLPAADDHDVSGLLDD